MKLIPDIPAKTFSFSAVAVGYLLIDDLTANEQNALGNWLMLTAQVLSTNAFYRQVQQERNNANSSSNSNTSNNTNNNNFSQTEKFNLDEEIIILKKMIVAINKEINNLKNSTN